ncbi:MAG: glutamyl-tRNA reductase [Pseudomonadota bacterium]|nr:glutamyl-tRNA reductase [Pseudomonadota bacterium]
MSINILGLNHKTAPIDIREKIVFNHAEVPLTLKKLKNIEGVNEVVLLSTCNRTEIYTENDKDNQKVINWLNNNQTSVKDYLPYTYTYEGEEAIKHLFHVASGMDSMVIGETEILGQVKDAYRIANEHKSINSSLKRLFEFAFSVAKEVRTNTEIGSNPITFMFTSITLIKKIYTSIENLRALVVGSGDMTNLAIKYLQSNKINQITLTSRKVDKGKTIAEENNCHFNRLQDLGNIISNHDIIITCTSSSLPIIGKGMVESSLSKRTNNPITIIDLGVPRDVESEIKEIDGIYLYTIDDLGKVIENNYKIRREALAQAEKIIDYKIIEFRNWLANRKSDTLIKSYRDYVDDITDGAIIKTKKMIDNGKDINEALLYLATTLKNKLTHETTSKLKEVFPLLDESKSLKIKKIFKKLDES